MKFHGAWQGSGGNPEGPEEIIMAKGSPALAILESLDLLAVLLDLFLDFLELHESI